MSNKKLQKPNKYIEINYQERFEIYQREKHALDVEYMKHKLRLEFNKSIEPLVNNLYGSGKISIVEYRKWLLDDTSEYIPKLNRDEK